MTLTVSQPVSITETVVVRLSKPVYEVLENKFSKLIVTSATTAHEAGYQIGVQAVLKELRSGYVVS